MNTNLTRLPQHRWPIWLLMAGVVLGLPLTAFVYFPALLQTGILPPDGDSIAIPMAGSIFLAILMLPIAVVLTYLCTRRYLPGASLTAWRIDRPLLSIAVTLFFIGPAALVLFLPVVMTLTSPTSFIEPIWAPYALCCAAWCIALRSAALASA